MRPVLLIAAALLIGCTPPKPPAPAPEPKVDPTTLSWYAPAVGELEQQQRRAAELFRAGKSDEASAIITEAQKIEERVLGVPSPTLAAMTAASDLDDLYGRMLMANHRYGYARLLFQKNVTRWKSWKPETPETLRHLKTAQTAMAECDRRIAE